MKEFDVQLSATWDELLGLIKNHKLFLGSLSKSCGGVTSLSPRVLSCSAHDYESKEWKFEKKGL